MKPEDQTFTCYFCSYRYTFFTKLGLINRWRLSEEKSDDEWSVKNSISVPKYIFGLLKSKGVPPNIVTSLGNVGLAEESFHVGTNVDRFELLVSFREVFVKTYPYPRTSWVICRT